MQQRGRQQRGNGSKGSFPRGPRRGVFWDDTVIDKTLAAGNQTTDSLMQGVPEDERKGITLTRLIIELWLNCLTVGTGITYAAGIYVVEDDAFAAGAMAEPGDVADDAGWVWRVLQIPVFTAEVNDFSQVTHVGPLDLRAQRKLPGEDYSLVLIQQHTSGTASFNMNGYIRSLYKRAS